MKRISVVLGVAALIAATVVLSAGAVLSKAETVQTVEQIPVSGEIKANTGFNRCTSEPEPITWEGTLHLVKNETTTPDGRWVGTYSATLKGSGVGTLSGTKYVTLLTDRIRGNYNPDTGMYIQTNNVQQMWLNQGPGEDLMARSVFHITLQPDGTYTVRVENYNYQCNGSATPPATATATATATAQPLP